ncbi:hypothetical protein PAXRUDRAFT_439517 [Paxillus rubicundulus Ve08.2h10]|uniref:Protein kinase domain-containing protein n=1 Tax=Paxillus rubicundulus Ve08.2h10 TaxID=930991 RepID=A0A0D0DX53_9AGAM|nr:hypothetical protein PAXRUDRAFT_439517 [Paxillus rubicundulus Ve08.2h10]
MVARGSTRQRRTAYGNAFVPRLKRHSPKQPFPTASGRSLLAATREPFGSLPVEHKDKQKVKGRTLSAVVSESQQDDLFRVDGSMILTFSRPSHDVTAYIKQKGRYPAKVGRISDVYKCVLEKPGEPGAVVAVKAHRAGFNDANAIQECGKKLKGEVYIWIRLDHPNVLKLCGIANGFGPLPALVSPWMENGDLTEYLEGPGRNISREGRISILVKVGEALHYIHSAPHHVVHGNLTGFNILIDNEGQPLISNFELSCILEEYNTTSYFKSHRLGSIQWAAPELLEEPPKFSIESDVYSYGCTMLHALSGQVPYTELRDIRIPYAKLNGSPPLRPTDHPIEDSHWELIGHCLDAIPSRRPKLPDVLALLRI